MLAGLAQVMIDMHVVMDGVMCVVHLLYVVGLPGTATQLTNLQYLSLNNMELTCMYLMLYVLILFYAMCMCNYYILLMLICSDTSAVECNALAYIPGFKC